MEAIANQSVTQMYRTFLRTAKQFRQYNMREYAVRRIRHDFRTLSNVPHDEISAQYQLLSRQTAISNMYPSDPSVLESFSN